ncbi:MAG: chemotaxis protein CheX [Magnetococcales bacterium]|nr:chemotaxis protein CheX [Magnetococcales bacterium]
MHIELTKTIISSVDEIVHSYFPLDYKVTPGAHFFGEEEDLDRRVDIGITAIIGFSGGLDGGLHLSAPIRTAMDVTGAFSDGIFEESDFSNMSNVITDAYGELANIIAGGVKRRLGGGLQLQQDINLTPPIVVWGQDYRMAYKSSTRVTKQYFEMHGGIFCVTVYY